MTNQQKLMGMVSGLVLMLLSLSPVFGQDNTVDYQVCGYYATNAGQIATMRDQGLPYDKVAQAIQSFPEGIRETMEYLVRFVYITPYMTPQEIEDFIMVECLNELANEA